MKSTEALARFAAAQDAIGDVVAQLGDGQWAWPTPCTEWTVRQLVNHVVGEQLWVAPMLAGRTVADVGAELDGDLMGDSPVSAWAAAAADARARFALPGALDGAINSSSGPKPADEYLAELTFDLVVHRWDLGRAVSIEQRFTDSECALVEESIAGFAGMTDTLVAAGVFAAPVDVAGGADRQTLLLAALGRTQ